MIQITQTSDPDSAPAAPSVAPLLLTFLGVTARFRIARGLPAAGLFLAFASAVAAPAPAPTATTTTSTTTGSSAGGTVVTTTTTTVSAETVLRHVFVIPMENHDWASIFGNVREAPFINGLL